jgi:hypothetical protein
MITLEQIEEQAITALEDKRKELGDNNALYAACPQIARAILAPLELETYNQLYQDNKEALDNAVMEYIHKYGIIMLSAQIKRSITITKIALQFHLTRILELSVY